MSMRRDKLENEQLWRPDDLVLAPEDLEQILYIEDARRLQAGIALLNVEIQRLFEESRHPHND